MLKSEIEIGPVYHRLRGRDAADRLGVVQGDTVVPITQEQTHILAALKVKKTDIGPAIVPLVVERFEIAPL